jgi:hypothetical protein
MFGLMRRGNFLEGLWFLFLFLFVMSTPCFIAVHVGAGTRPSPIIDSFSSTSLFLRPLVKEKGRQVSQSVCKVSHAQISFFIFFFFLLTLSVSACKQAMARLKEGCAAVDAVALAISILEVKRKDGLMV